jgi:hypothetical protein
VVSTQSTTRYNRAFFFFFFFFLVAANNGRHGCYNKHCNNGAKEQVFACGRIEQENDNPAAFINTTNH